MLTGKQCFDGVVERQS